MRRKHFFAVLSGLVAVALVAADASATYHPTLGRWLQRDPIGYADGMGLYEYAKGTPPNTADPTGLSEFEVVTRTILKEPGPGESRMERLMRVIGRLVEAQHPFVVRNDNVILEGFIGGTGRAGQVRFRWPLKQAEEGQLRWGPKKGADCRCASGDMIERCVRSAPKPRYEEFNAAVNNCQQDIEHATRGCCLTGYSAPVIGPMEWNYMSNREREEEGNVGWARDLLHAVKPLNSMSDRERLKRLARGALLAVRPW